ncbi:PhzF family phenazine biosynthesis protein [Salipiger sp. IMCC34102]|uniref:PhzF family phenazine biosynthesis protein n=1 Tax=Salipiger sp. IMCC34102 TaxID=2510647 RepID=UPI00101D16A7|nr:PhzF family phenazine biosynthesis protein [Salipiger sp. IMCC34102]RYH03470.1 PhzF family phenazine biosynthesis protein [Salipiger sp. IMCC34102]
MTVYVVYDVFTDTPFGGNQLAVIPDGEGVKPELLQKITAEFNFSEAVFVYPPDDLRHTAKLRIFTPLAEVPFAGHPLIGTAVALAAMGFPTDMILETGSGPIPCTVEGRTASFTVATPLTRHAEPDPALVARALGLAEGDLDQLGHPPVQADVGLPFTFVRLTDRAALSRACADVAAMREGRDRYPAAMDFACFAYVRDGDTVHARMFAPLDNIPEDPATGSASAALAALLRELDGADQSVVIHQGEDMGRPSRIKARAGAAGVTITGTAVQTMEGRLVL